METPLLPAALLHQALQACAADPNLARRIEDGRMHEDMLLMGAYDLLREAGIPARLVSVHSSTHPLGHRDAPGEKPSGYAYHSAVYLEVDGSLLRLHARNTPWNHLGVSLQAQRFARPEDALAAHQVGPHHAWIDEDPADWGPEALGVDEIAIHNNLPLLRASLLQVALDQSTPQAPTPRPGPRL